MSSPDSAVYSQTVKLLQKIRSLISSAPSRTRASLPALLDSLQKTTPAGLHPCSGAAAAFRHRQGPWKRDIRESFADKLRSVSALSSRSLEKSVSVAEDASVFLLGSSGLLITQDHYLLRESVFYDEIEVGDLPDLLLPAERVIDKPCVSLCGVWCFEFWHWVLEYLPRLLLAEAIDQECLVLLPHERPSYAVESLEALGVSPERIVDVGAEALYLTHAIIPERLCASKELLTVPSVTYALRERFQHLFSEERRDRKVYVSRKHAKKRRILNEEELLEVLKPFGFEEVVLEKLSFEEQIRLHSETSALVALHGAGLVHTLFMPERSFVLEIFPKKFKYPNCPFAQFLLQHEYVGIEERIELSSEEKALHPRDRDIEAPLADIQDALNYFQEFISSAGGLAAHEKNKDLDNTKEALNKS